jgi:hypothetical protein
MTRKNILVLSFLLFLAHLCQASPNDYDEQSIKEWVEHCDQIIEDLEKTDDRYELGYWTGRKDSYTLILDYLEEIKSK